MSEIPAVVEHETGPCPSYNVIWFHGLGADGHDFEAIVPELVASSWPAVRFIFPHAPIQALTLNAGMPMRAWYDIRNFDLYACQDEAGIHRSIAATSALIARENARGIPDGSIVLAGFSQGGALALAAGLRHTHRLAGIVALSTYLVLGDDLAIQRSSANMTTPIFQGHGTFDPVVTLAQGRAAHDQLVALDYRVDWHSYPMAHTLCTQEISDLRHWLGQRFSA